MKRTFIVRVGVAILVAAISLGAVAGASAQATDPQTRPTLRLSDDLVEAVAEATGLEEADVWAALYAGETLAEIAEANGGDPDLIVADVAAQVEADISAAVEDGTLSDVQADRWLERLPDVLDRAMYFSHAGARARVRAGVGGVHQLIEAAVSETGLTRLEIWQALDDGQTLAEIAEANGSSPDALVQAALDHTADHLDVAVFHGRLTEEQKAVLLDEAAERYPELVDEALPDVVQRPIRQGMRPLRGRGMGGGRLFRN